jgi:hypothetical protein
MQLPVKISVMTVTVFLEEDKYNLPRVNAVIHMHMSYESYKSKLPLV